MENFGGLTEEVDSDLPLESGGLVCGWACYSKPGETDWWEGLQCCFQRRNATTLTHSWHTDTHTVQRAPACCATVLAH